MCEFGYVIADEKLCVLEKRVITINPEKPFRLVGRENRADLALCFSEETYRESPTFPHFYREIKELLEYPEQIIVGFSIHNDALFLKIACERYGLEFLQFGFVDIQKAFKTHTKGGFVVSLEKALETLQIPKLENQHRSDDDSLGTLMILRSICPVDGESAQTVDKIFPNAVGNSKKINELYTGCSLSGMLKAFDRDESCLSFRKRENLLKKFTEGVKPTGRIVRSKLNMKTLCLNQSYEKKHLRETLIIIQLLANHGCRYNSKASQADFYVASRTDLSSEEVNKKSRYFAATNRENGESAEVITLDKLCEILGIREEDLPKMAMPKAPKKKNKNKIPQNGNHVTERISMTIGELMRNQGKAV